MKTPASWPTGPTYRACVVCRHGRGTEGKPRGEADVCTCPDVTGRRTQAADWPIGVPVQVARSNGGPCGPEAYHLTFPGL